MGDQPAPADAIRRSPTPSFDLSRSAYGFRTWAPGVRDGPISPNGADGAIDTCFRQTKLAALYRVGPVPSGAR